MPVRRYSPSNETGYGSLGKTQLIPGVSTRYLLWLESQNIHQISLQTPQNPDAPISFVYHILHTWKFTALSFNTDSTKVYNAEIGKRQLGTVICKHRGYVTDEANVSFSDQMSDLMVTAVNYKGTASQELEIPCDEPPSDSVFIPLPNSAYQACSGYGFGNGVIPLVMSASTKLILADDVQFYPNKGLTSYIFGAGYRYTTTTYTNSYTQANGDIVVVNQ